MTFKAYPIQPTPTLEGEDAINFLNRMQDLEAEPKKKIVIPDLKKIDRILRKVNRSKEMDDGLSNTINTDTL